MSWRRAPLHSTLCSLVLSLTAAIEGCGGPMVFENAGSPNTFEQDQSACQLLQNTDPFAQAYARDPLGNMGYPIMARRDMRQCLERKGWRQKDGEDQAKKSEVVAELSQPGAQPKAEGATPRLKFGTVVAEVTPTIANLLKMDEVGGVFVTAVYADSVASRAGIKKGDIILKYGDKILSTDLAQLQAALAATPPGSTVPVTIWRNNSTIVLSAQF